MALSNSRRRISACRSDRRRLSTSHLVGSGVERRSDRRDQAVPTGGFFLEPSAPGGRERVVLRLSVVLTLTPLGGDETLMLEAVQGWVQGLLMDLPGAIIDLANPTAASVSSLG